jgi:hypothetical protein
MDNYYRVAAAEPRLLCIHQAKIAENTLSQDYYYARRLQVTFDLLRLKKIEKS